MPKFYTMKNRNATHLQQEREREKEKEMERKREREKPTTEWMLRTDVATGKQYWSEEDYGSDALDFQQCLSEADTLAKLEEFDIKNSDGLNACQVSKRKKRLENADNRKKQRVEQPENIIEKQIEAARHHVLRRKYGKVKKHMTAGDHDRTGRQRKKDGINKYKWDTCFTKCEKKSWCSPGDWCDYNSYCMPSNKTADDTQENIDEPQKCIPSKSSLPKLKEATPYEKAARSELFNEGRSKKAVISSIPNPPPIQYEPESYSGALGMNLDRDSYSGEKAFFHNFDPRSVRTPMLPKALLGRDPNHGGRNGDGGRNRDGRYGRYGGSKRNSRKKTRRCRRKKRKTRRKSKTKQRRKKRKTKKN